jgi:pyridoxal phosphate enzyme (YggS family)
VTEPRRTELRANLATVRHRIEVACAAAGRDPHDVSLVAVTKTWPASDVRLLAELGVTDVGENRDQEARPKHVACADLGLRWHFVGRLQRNKSGSVATYADVVHSVDRQPLVTALDRAAGDAGRVVTALIQVSLDATAGPARGGARPDLVDDLAAQVAAAGSLRLGGVMAVAPLDADPDTAFARLAEVAARLRDSHPEAVAISAGMSGDLEPAVRHGATHLRIGTALLGHRESPVR